MGPTIIKIIMEFLRSTPGQGQLAKCPSNTFLLLETDVKVDWAKG